MIVIVLSTIDLDFRLLPYWAAAGCVSLLFFVAILFLAAVIVGGPKDGQL
jgi:hypothetical protein